MPVASVRKAAKTRALHGLMKLPPHQFYIGDKLWKVRYGDNRPKRGLFKPDPKYHKLGYCVYTEKTIYLNPMLRLKKHRFDLWQVFAHELLHALDHRLGHKAIARLQGPMASVFLVNSFYLGVPAAARPRRRRGSSRRLAAR